MEMYCGLVRPEEALKILKETHWAKYGENLSLKQVGDITGFSENRVESLLILGDLEQEHVGLKILISKLSLMRYLVKTRYNPDSDKLYFDK